MDLLRYPLNVKVHWLHHSRVRSPKNVFIHRAPGSENKHSGDFLASPAVVKWASDLFFQIRLRYNANTHVRTLCLPITKEILLLQGLTKLDQLVSSTMYSPFRAQKRMDEGSMGCPAYW